MSSPCAVIRWVLLYRSLRYVYTFTTRDYTNTTPKLDIYNIGLLHLQHGKFTLHGARQDEGNKNRTLLVALACQEEILATTAASLSFHCRLTHASRLPDIFNSCDSNMSKIASTCSLTPFKSSSFRHASTRRMCLSTLVMDKVAGGRVICWSATTACGPMMQRVEQ